MKKITFLLTLFVSLNLYASDAVNKDELLQLIVYKSPTCGCCKEWLKHLDTAAIKHTAKEVDNMRSVKEHYKVRSNYQSCHTAVTKEGYVFEGHVPAKFIKKFLAEKPDNAFGLSVPGMPIGSPGMEMGERFQPYEVIVLLKDGSYRTYAKVSTYDEQF